MGRGFIPGLATTSQTAVRRRRELPLPGTIAVKIGQSVRASDVVAKAELPGELRIVRVAQNLSIEPDDVIRGLKVKLGDYVEAGALLCEHKGFFGLIRCESKSPISGNVELITESTGHVGIRGSSIPLNLSAYISGEIVEIEASKGVVIQSSATFVQGIFGVGGERFGVLKMLGVTNDRKLVAADIPQECRDAILVGGCSPTAECLNLAMTRGAVGFVCGSIDDTALKEFLGYDLGMALTGDEAIEMTVIITEGFGYLPISERVIKCLSVREGSACSVNGATQVRAGAVRPEIIVPHGNGIGSSIQASNDVDGELRVGLAVRIIRVPYFGKVGTVTELPHDPEPIATEAVTRVVRVQIGEGSVVTVPRANVERVDG